MAEWISVKERLPAAYESVLVVILSDYGDGDISQYISIDEYDGVRFDQYSELVTHWMPLPEPPNEEK